MGENDVLHESALQIKPFVFIEVYYVCAPSYPWHARRSETTNWTLSGLHLTEYLHRCSLPYIFFFLLDGALLGKKRGRGPAKLAGYPQAADLTGMFGTMAVQVGQRREKSCFEGRSTLIWTKVVPSARLSRNVERPSKQPL
jgi:hypothetical protein